MRVLVVEDDIRLANIIARGLTEAGYAVDNAYDGEEAEYMAETTPYNIIILDLMLPRKDGLAVCRDLRMKKINIPILMLTAKDTIDDRISGLDSGADDYLVKPFAFSELAARIRALSRREAEQKTHKLKFKDLEMDLLSREIRRGTRKIEMTAKEFAMLEYFLRHQHVVLTRTMLEENIWNYSFDATSNVVDVYVRRLRLLLDDGSGDNLIETVRGAGYRLG